MSVNKDLQETDQRMASSTGDPPIRRKKEDRLNRARFAEALAEQIAGVPGQGGVVFGLLGSYGSGKTSILNMVEETLKEDLEGPVVLWFNPWLFSGTEQLVEHFFEELAAQLLEEPDDRLRRIGEVLERYGKLLGPLRYVPGVGRYAEGAEKATGILGGLLKGREEKPVSVRSRRRELERALNNLNGKIMIFIDDLDRLSRKDEIQDVIRLVRLNATLPNLVFVMAFDRWRVEGAPRRGRRRWAGLPGEDRAGNTRRPGGQRGGSEPAACREDQSGHRTISHRTVRRARVLERLPHRDQTPVSKRTGRPAIRRRAAHDLANDRGRGPPDRRLGPRSDTTSGAGRLRQTARHSRNAYHRVRRIRDWEKFGQRQGRNRRLRESW
jgi:hypothetical protein